MSDRPNVLLIVTDQHRGDCVGADPHSLTTADGGPIVHTPNLNSMVGEGALFSRAYSPAPSCAPARRCLWTGLTPATANATGWTTTPWDHEHYLPAELADAGYQTAHVGKLHTNPPDKDIGFEKRVKAQHATGAEVFKDGPGHEYDSWLWEQSDHEYIDLSHGLDSNSWDARPTHLAEEETDTFWRTSRAVETLVEMDASDDPFFLTLSHWNPHQPFDPPYVYYDMYRDLDLPAPYIGDWIEQTHGHHLPAYPKLNAPWADLPAHIVRRARACYFGLITQLDQQLTRVMRLLFRLGELENTFIIVTSDHGEMLGDHHLWRKCFAYEGSARVPFILRFPQQCDLPRGQTVDRPVGLEDVFPTVMDVVGLDTPAAIEGRSVLDLLRDQNRRDWREYYHGEHASLYTTDNACQYVVDRRFKFVWNPVTGDELLFDLVEDPGETRDLSGLERYADRLETCRTRLVEELDSRERQFTKDGALHATERPYNWPMEGRDGQFAGRLSGLY